MPPKYPEDITKLFKPRPRPRFIPKEEEKQGPGLTGFGFALELIKQLEMPEHTSEPILPVNERRIAKREQKIRENDEKLKVQRESYNPTENPEATSQPYNTLFLSGITEKVTAEQIRSEFCPFGPVKDIKFVYDKSTGKRKNYCFVEFEKEESFIAAMKQGRKLQIDGKWIIVDCERGRTVPNWLPRRLGGGYGENPRRFTESLEVMQCLSCRKRKRTGYKCGVKYRGTMAEVARKREEKHGLVRKPRRYGS